MAETYELCYSNKATINTGNYSNLNPFYNLKRIITIETGMKVDLEQEFKQMREIVDKQLQFHLQTPEEKPSFRLYERDGKKYVSVTTVISPIPPDIPNLDLYGLRGQILHRIFNKMVVEAKYLFEVTEEERKKLSPILNIDDYHFKWVIDDDRFDFRSGENVVYNDDELYAGRYDTEGFFEDIPAIFELKSGVMNKEAREKAFLQMAAYIKTGMPIETMVIIPIHPKVKPEPIVSNEVEKYFGMFLERRKSFKKTYGI